MRLKKKIAKVRRRRRGVFDFANWIFYFFFNSQFGDFYVFLSGIYRWRSRVWRAVMDGGD